MSHEFAPQIKHFLRFDLIKQVPENPISRIPVLIAPGFGSNAQSYQILMEQLNSHGFITISPTYEYGTVGEPKKWLFFPDVDRLKQQSILELIENEGHPNQQGVRQVNVVAHSKGAYDVALVAIKHPEKFRNIIMIAPGNLRPVMFPVKGVTTLIEGERRDEIDKDRITEGNADFAKTIRTNNTYGARYRKDTMRHTLEGITSGTKYMRKLLPKLRERGVKIVIICQKNDAMYPPKSFDNFVRTNVNKFEEIEGIHGELKFNPKVGQVVADFLKRMEDNKPL